MFDVPQLSSRIQTIPAAKRDFGQVFENGFRYSGGGVAIAVIPHRPNCGNQSLQEADDRFAWRDEQSSRNFLFSGVDGFDAEPLKELDEKPRMVGEMVDAVRPLDAANVPSVPTIQNRSERREDGGVVLGEREPNPAILIARAQPAIDHEPTESQAEFAGPFGRQVENRRFSIFPDVDVRWPEGKRPIFGELSFP